MHIKENRLIAKIENVYYAGHGRLAKVTTGTETHACAERQQTNEQVVQHGAHTSMLRWLVLGIYIDAGLYWVYTNKLKVLRATCNSDAKRAQESSNVRAWEK